MKVLARLLLALVTVPLVSGCFWEGQQSLEELKTQSFRVDIDGIDFDVPVLYHYNAYDQRRNRWPTPTLAEKLGLRRSVDTLQFKALLPDIEPYSENNGKSFAELGHGKKVRVSVLRNESGNHEYFFRHTFPRFHRADNGLSIDGFVRYEDRAKNRVRNIVYLNRDTPGDDLVIIQCDLEGSAVSPSCWVTAPYLDHLEVMYYFGLPHLSEWPTMHKKLIALLEDFRQVPKSR